ncbi:hypothetical protein C8R42DRAFT_714175 [Lentinula raphanica]|nr:hypothetical protein C8R42DRAFT_714175 [Lentinula raphanica]
MTLAHLHLQGPTMKDNHFCISNYRISLNFQPVKAQYGELKIVKPDDVVVDESNFNTIHTQVPKGKQESLLHPHGVPGQSSLEYQECRRPLTLMKISRRQLRYTRAERSLLISFHAHVDAAAPSNDSVTPSLQVQLRLLNQAASRLTAQATDIRIRMDAASQGVLQCHSGCDTEKYKQALIEKWKDERSLERIQDEVKRVEAVIASISTKSSTHPASVPNLDREGKKTCSTAYDTHYTHAPRRMTLTDVKPIRARPWSVTDAFTKKYVHPKTVTLAVGTRLEVSTSSQTFADSNRGLRLPQSGALSDIAEGESLLALENGENVEPAEARTPSSMTISILCHTDCTEILNGADTTVGVTANAKVDETMTASCGLLTDYTSISEDNDKGTATIFSHSPHHLNFENIQLEVEIPIYAQDLFAILDRIGSEFENHRPLENAYFLGTTTSSSSSKPSPQTPEKQHKHSSLPPPSAFLTPPRLLSRSSGSLKGRNSTLKPSVSLGNLHPDSRTTKSPLERERSSLLSIPESSSMLSLSSSQISLAPPKLELDGHSALTATSPAPGTPTERNVNVVSGEGSDNSDSTPPRPSSTVKRLKRRLSSRLSLAMFGSPTKATSG